MPTVRLKESLPLKRFAILLSVLALSGSVSIPAQNQKPIDPDDDVVRVETTLVVLSVRVKDRHGRFVVNAGSVFEH
jgi:hypothetical protein